MDHNNRQTVRALRFAMVLVLASLAVHSFVPENPASAGSVVVVKGIVGSVSGNLIYLDGKSIDLKGIPVRNPSGKELSIADIDPGMKVALFYRRGSLSSALVYEPMVE